MLMINVFWSLQRPDDSIALTEDISTDILIVGGGINKFERRAGVAARGCKVIADQAKLLWLGTATLGRKCWFSLHQSLSLRSMTLLLPEWSWVSKLTAGGISVQAFR